MGGEDQLVAVLRMDASHVRVEPGRVAAVASAEGVLDRQRAAGVPACRIGGFRWLEIEEESEDDEGKQSMFHWV